MATKPENVRYETKRRAEGWVRGPRITADAAEALSNLAHDHRLSPSIVVSRLLLGISLDYDLAATPGDLDGRTRETMRQRLRFSEQEMADFERMKGAGRGE
jgi:hypothetical protein